MNHEQYGKFVCLSKEAEEKLSKMDEQDINILASSLAHGQRESYKKILLEKRNALNGTN